MKLYSGPLSLFSRKVEIALTEKGLPFDREMVAFTQERGYQPKHPDVLDANPKGQVPVLVDGDVTVFDSTLIFEYLEDAYPSPPLMPRTPKERAECRKLELYADEILFPPARTLGYRAEQPLQDADRQRARDEEGLRAEEKIGAEFARLDELLRGRAFLCDALSVADIGMFMTVLWTQRLKGPSLARYTELDGWFNRLYARPAFAQATDEIVAADVALSPGLRRL